MKPIKLFIAILSICFVSFTTASSSDKTGALLWKVSGNGLEKPSYLLGTLHLASKATFDSIPGAMKMLEESEQVVGELVISELMAQTVKLQQAGMMPADTTYDMLYTEEEYKKVSDGIKEHLGADLSQLGVLKPNLIQISVISLMYQKIIPDFNANEAMDGYVQQYASSVGKDILALETIENQIDVLFNNTSLKRQAELLLCFFEHFGEAQDDAIKLVYAYKRADFAAMEAMFNDTDGTCPSTQAEMDAMLKNRNDNWIKKLPEIMSGKSSFIAVGAGHLVGEYGLLAQLEKLGYTIEPVK